MMNSQVEVLPQYRIAYVRQVGPYGAGNIQAMDRLKTWAKERQLLDKSAILLGIPQDNPETTLPEKCRYDAGIIISNDYIMDGSLHEGVLPGGAYMICKIRHTAEAIQKAWAEIFPALLNSGYQTDNRPIFERYTGTMVNIEYCELCVPVKPI